MGTFFYFANLMLLYGKDGKTIMVQLGNTLKMLKNFRVGGKKLGTVRKPKIHIFLYFRPKVLVFIAYV